MSNCVSDHKNMAFVGRGQEVFSFDLRKESVLIEDLFSKTQKPHEDEINHLAFSNKYNILSAADDAGDVYVYSSPELKLEKKLEQQHLNICYASDFIEPSKAKGPVIVSSGFDCRINIWNV